jgi:hypothetical protein
VRKFVVSEFMGNVTRLIHHKEAGMVVNDIYRDICTPSQKLEFLQELYGPEFRLFKVLFREARLTIERQGIIIETNSCRETRKENHDCKESCPISQELHEKGYYHTRLGSHRSPPGLGNLNSTRHRGTPSSIINNRYWYLCSKNNFNNWYIQKMVHMQLVSFSPTAPPRTERP